jgi:hypothetical protein
MILDKQDSFLTVTTALENLGGHASGVSDYRDTGAVGANDGHRKLYLNIVGVSDLVDADGTPTVTIALVSDSAVGFATAKVTDWTSAAIAKDALAAYRAKVLLPEDIKRYARIEWTLSNGGDSGGLFKAFLSVQ